MAKRDDTVEVSWEVEDGYVGSRPQYAYIPKDELAECESEGDVHALIDDYVKAMFEDRITYGATSSSVKEVLEVWNELKEQNGEED